MNLQDFLDAQDRLDDAKQEVHLAKNNFETIAGGLAKTLLKANFWTLEEIDQTKWQERMRKIFNFRESLWEIEWTPSVVKGYPPNIRSLRQITQPTELKDLPA